MTATTEQIAATAARDLPRDLIRSTRAFGNPPRLLRDGGVVCGGQTWDADRDGLPPGTGTELLAEAGGLLKGRFLLTAAAGKPLTLEQRLAAVAFADQAGAALSGGRSPLARA